MTRMSTEIEALTGSLPDAQVNVTHWCCPCKGLRGDCPPWLTGWKRGTCYMLVVLSQLSGMGLQALGDGLVDAVNNVGRSVRLALPFMAGDFNNVSCTAFAYIRADTVVSTGMLMVAT